MVNNPCLLLKFVVNFIYYLITKMENTEMEICIKEAVKDLSDGISHITEKLDQYLTISNMAEIVINPADVFNKLPKWASIEKADTGRTPKHSDLITVEKAAARFKYAANGNNYNTEQFAQEAESTSNFAASSIDVVFWKYAMLCQMGWEPDTLSMWVVQTRDTNIKHAILVVHETDKEWLLNSMAIAGEEIPEPIEVTPHYMNKTFKFMCRIREKDSI